MPTAVTRPVLETVATAGLELVQVTFLLTASAGVMVAVSCSVPYVLPFMRSVVEVLFRDTPSTGVGTT